MKIGAATQFLVFANILNSIELGSQVTLKELFPGYKRGEIPPIRTFKYKPNSQLLQLRRKDADKVDEFPMHSILIARAHAIIGWKKQDIIRPVCDLSGKANQVYDIDKDQFVSLSSNELWKLGVDRRFSQSCKDDIAAANRKSITTGIHQENNKTNNQLNNREIRPVQYQSIQQEIYPQMRLSNNQVIQQGNLHAVNHLSPAEIHPAHYQASYLTSHEAIHPAHHQIIQQAGAPEIHSENYQENYKVHPQEYLAQNKGIQQAYYEMYEKALKGHMP